MTNISRRTFIKTGAFAAAGLTIVPGHVLGRSFGFTAPSDKLNIAGIGVGGMGRRNLANMSTENIVALCDVDWHYADKTFKDYPNARRFKDWRVMFDEIGSSIDAVMVATPDHTHAGVTAHAITLGKHCYTQKPLTHSVYESRLLTRLAKKYKVATQMGNQGNSFDWCRQVAEWIQSGIIGDVYEVHCWTDRPIWPQGLQEPKTVVKCPKTLDWEMWIGPAPMNVYNEELAPPMERNMFPNWRNYREYGGGMICDWGAHMFDIAQWALGMDDSGPIEFTPPEEGELKPLSMRYANGTVMTHEPFRKADGNAVRFIGSDGVIDISRSFLDTIPAKLQDEVIGDDKIKLYKSDDHYNDFLTAMKTRKQPLSTVEIGHRTASLCHIVNLCYEFDRKLVWNPEKEEFFFDDEANRRRGNPIREPYSLKV